jgi:hypothetical protein
MDNNQNYKWSPEDKITITGAQFDSLQRFVAVMSEVLTAFIPDAIQTRKEIVEQMIEQGIAKSYSEEPSPEGPTEESPSQEVINPS